MSKENIIEFSDFNFQYFTQAKPTLHNINLSIKKGEKILIVGPSGSGKSTLGHCLNGLIPFSYNGEITGSLKILGQETQNMDIFKLSKILGTVLQDPDGQFVGLSVYEDIAFALENDNIPQLEMKERVHKAAVMVDMESFHSSSPYELSGGQKQRTSLAGVLVDDVDILLFDEPLANLDPATGKAAIEIIDDIHKDTDKTIIIIEHRLEDVLHRNIDRVILMSDGYILADMDADTLMASPVLIDNGIREPLYVTALKYAGVDVTKQLRAGHIESLQIEAIQRALQDWNATVVADQPAEKQDTLLELQNISFSYDGVRPIIDDVSFKLEKGELIAIVGKNGAGKSTLSRLVSGFEKESKGTISYLGEDMSDLTIKERAEKIAVVMQNPNQMISKALIYDEVALGLRLRNIEEDEIAERVEKVLKVCGLAPFRKWPIAALSFGQKKRVTIASILVLNPEIIILDEPTAGQDFKHYTQIMEFVNEINRLGVAIILITHDMHLMLEYASRAIVISGGKKIADARPSDILTDPEIIEQANLKETSLYQLSQSVGIADGTAFVQNFIDFEKKVRAIEQ
ncbi:MAG: heme ABC transporter ATP-binding protein [Spirochaetaceae bacterium 4572_59]|nr:MAG: heme ABC transporter ATP-binding protein [Spirochaetaceae bacterium 4572_59]